MGSLRVRTAVLAALLSVAACPSARAQDEPAEPDPVFEPTEPEEDSEGTPPEEEPMPEELAGDPPSSTPSEPSPPLVPPGGVPEVGGPAPGQAERPEPERPPPAPPIPPPIYVVELAPRATFPVESSFDRALSTLRYRSVRVVPNGYVGMHVPVVEWLWLGGRIGMRGMTWRHLTRDDATVVAGELLATAQLRFSLGRVVELGLLAGGGVGWMSVELDGVGSDQLAPRFVAEGIIAFRPDRHVAIGPRFGWEYFVWEGMNAYDHALDIGGPFFGVAVEGRE